MPTYQTTGIVIGRTNFGEADRIVRLITPEHGKLSAVAKGVRKIKSRLGGHLELLAEAKLTLATGRNLEVVTGAQLVWYPHRLATDLPSLEQAYRFVKLIDRTAQEHQSQPALYAHLAEALRELERSGHTAYLELWFDLRLLNLSGFRPELTRCVICGKRSESEQYSLSIARGGIVCQADNQAGDEPLSQAAVKLWRLLCDYPFSTVAQIQNGPSLANQTLPLCQAFLRYHLAGADG
jgi:DNA repair protein RecO (recombination protein O)